MPDTLKTCLLGFGGVCALRACQPNYHYAGRALPALRIDQVGAGELSAQCFVTKLSLRQAESVDSSPWCAAMPILAQPGLPNYQIGSAQWCAGRNYHCTGRAMLCHPALRHEIRALYA